MGRPVLTFPHPEIPLKALSIKQPWATLIVRGLKKYETRSWKTNFRGEIVIVSAKTFPYELKELCLRPPFRGVLPPPPGDPSPEDLQRWYDETYPTGCLMGTARLIECHPVAYLTEVSETEREFGNFGPNRYGWELRDPRSIPLLPYRGALGVYDVPDELIPQRP